jgi:predicted O-methyltransferase YrrM
VGPVSGWGPRGAVDPAIPDVGRARILPTTRTRKDEQDVRLPADHRTYQARKLRVGQAMPQSTSGATPRSDPDAPDPAVWAAVDRYFIDLFALDDPVLGAALRASEVAGLPAIQVSPLQGRLLHLLAQVQGARRILEIGTLGGYSAIWLARALPPEGKLVTLELERRHAEVAVSNLERAGLADRVEVRVGRAVESLSQLAAERAGPFDLVFIDADKESYPEYLAWALRLSRTGTLIVADNVIRNGAIVEARHPDPRVQGIRRFFDALAADPRLEVAAVPMVGLKGYDGWAIARVTSEGPVPAHPKGASRRSRGRRT